MSAPGGQDNAALKQEAPEKVGFLERMKDKLNVTKHLGFVSDLDSPANQAALAAFREREEREGPTEVEPQAPLFDRVKDVTAAVGQAGLGAATVAAGGALPPVEDESDRERAEDLQPSGGDGSPPPEDGKSSVASIPAQDVKSSDKSTPPDDLKSSDKPTLLQDMKSADESSAPQAVKSSDDAQVAKDSQHKSSWGHWVGHKAKGGKGANEASAASPSKDSDAPKDDHSLMNWAVRTAKKAGHAVASKDLSEELLAKDSKSQSPKGST